MQATPGPARRGALLKWIARLFFVCGFTALGWCAYVISDAYLAQRQGRDALVSMSSHEDRAAPSAPAIDARPSRPAPVKVARGTPLAELTIPRLGLSAIVLHGADEKTLRLGLGHIENTPMPGQSGNVAIAGHRDTFLRPLRNVRVGDDILLDTPSEHVRYRVASFRVVSPHEVSVIAPTKDAELTLVTCYPFWFVGSAPERFIVHANRVDAPTTATAAAISSIPAASVEAHASYIKVPKSGTPAATASLPAADSPDRAAPAAKASVPDDDDAGVRRAVDRFRAAYNARLARDGETRVDGFVTLPFCAVAVGDQTATATCSSAPESAEDQSPVWDFILDKIGGEWSVTSVAMR